MEFQRVIQRRHMVRRFSAEPVPQASIDRVLRNAVRGPSTGFSQGQAFLVLTGDDLPKFWAVAGEAVAESAQTARLVVVPLSSKRVYLDRYAEPDKGWTDRDEARWPVPFWHIDTGMAALLILLTVVDEGLGAVYFGIVPEAVDPLRGRTASRPTTSRSARSPSGTARRQSAGTSRPGAARCLTRCTTDGGDRLASSARFQRMTSSDSHRVLVVDRVRAGRPDPRHRAPGRKNPQTGDPALTRH